MWDLEWVCMLAAYMRSHICTAARQVRRFLSYRAESKVVLFTRNLMAVQEFYQSQP